MAENILGCLSADIICAEKRTVFRERKSRKPVSYENKDNVQGQISEHIFAPNGGYCPYYPSNLFHSARSFENWGIFNNYSLKRRWLAVDIYRATKRRGKYPTRALIRRAVKRAGPSKKVWCSRLGSTKTRRFQIYYTLELRFLKNLHETPFYVNRRIFCCTFCSKAMRKGEFFRDENRLKFRAVNE